MKAKESLVQAELEPSEFAYVLHSLRAENVVGINNEQLVPREAAVRTAQLQLGLAKLLEHGWFVAGEDGIDANDLLMLMVAVVAEPAYVLAATHYLEGNARQTLAYYVNHGISVELFQAASGNYVLSRLATTAELAGRLHAAFGALLAPPRWSESLIFALPEFEAALAQARAGDYAALQAAVANNQGGTAELADLSRTLRQLRPVGRIEGAVVVGANPGAWRELALLGQGSTAGWLARQDEHAHTITLWPADEKQLARLVEELVDALSAEAAGPAVVGR